MIGIYLPERRVSTYTLLLVTWLLFQLPVTAQTERRARVPQMNRGSISGRVLDERGAVVPGATVTLKQNASGFERTSTTDAAGSFHFNDVPAGDYRVNAKAAGFSVASQTLAIALEDFKVDLIVKPGTITEQVTVTASRAESAVSDTPVPVSVVERTELERQSVNTVGDLFRNLPGAATVNEGPFQVRPRIRGLDSNRVLVLVDGERLNNTRTSTSNSGIEIGLVDVDAIEKVEVARGSGSVLYGTDALAATINIITRETPERREAGFRFGGGLSGLFRSSETGRRGSAYLAGAGSRFAFRVAQTLDRFANYHSGAVPRTNGAKDSSPAATEVLNSQYHGSNTHVVGRFFMNDSQSIKAAYERRRAADVGVAGVVGVFTAFFPFSNRDKASVRYEGQNLSTRLARLSASAYFQKQDRNFSNLLNVPAAPPFFPGQFQFSETITKTRTSGFDFQSNWLLGRDNVVTAGVQLLPRSQPRPALHRKIFPELSHQSSLADAQRGSLEERARRRLWRSSFLCAGRISTRALVTSGGRLARRSFRHQFRTNYWFRPAAVLHSVAN